MNPSQLFQYDETRSLRVIEQDKQPWFAATDVCALLEIGNAPMAVNRLPEEEKITISFADSNPRSGKPHELTYVSEPGLYRLIFRSNKEEAKKFQDWVFREVLPQIRRTGGFQLDGVVVRDTLSVPEWLAEMGVDLVTDATLAELLCQRVASATHLLRHKDASFREADGFQRIPRTVADMARGLFLRDVKAPANRGFYQTVPTLGA